MLLGLIKKSNLGEMKYEQRMELAVIAEEAVRDNDIERLQKIWKIIHEDINQSEEIIENEAEWFMIIVPVDLQEIIFNQNN